MWTSPNLRSNHQVRKKLNQRHFFAPKTQPIRRGVRSWVCHSFAGWLMTSHKYLVEVPIWSKKNSLPNNDGRIIMTTWPSVCCHKYPFEPSEFRAVAVVFGNPVLLSPRQWLVDFSRYGSFMCVNVVVTRTTTNYPTAKTHIRLRVGCFR